MNLTNQIIRYETADDFTYNEFVELFAKLIANGQAWTLQGHFGRTALALIQDGRISLKGEILNSEIDNYEQ